MKLRELLHNIIDVNFDVEIKGVTCNPKRVKEGYLFVCVSERSKEYANGKTSVVEFCRQIWQNSGYNAASIGTLGTCINNGRKGNSNSLTTPGAEDLYATLRGISVEHLVLESSSHGIDQYRIHGLKLSAAAFTNFSQDHLDYHKSLGGYLETKKRLFYEVLPEGKRF